MTFSDFYDIFYGITFTLFDVFHTFLSHLSFCIVPHFVFSCISSFILFLILYVAFLFTFFFHLIYWFRWNHLYQLVGLLLFFLLSDKRYSYIDFVLALVPLAWPACIIAIFYVMIEDHGSILDLSLYWPYSCFHYDTSINCWNWKLKYPL